MEDKIKSLLQEADRMAGHPSPVPANLSAAVRRRANRRHYVHLFVPYAAAALLILTAGILTLANKSAKTTQEQNKIALLETQIEQLSSSMKLLNERFEEERQQAELDEMEAELASYTDPLESIEKKIDETAWTLVYNADRLYYELKKTDKAVEIYNQVIKLFPRNQWAQVARERLSEIENENRKFNKTEPKGELKWNPQNVTSSC